MPARSARARTASSWATVSGTLSTAKSVSRRSRRSGPLVRVVAPLVAGVGLPGFVRLAMITRLLTELLIFGSATRRHWFVQQRFQMTTLLVGQGFQNTLGLGLGRQDAFNCLRRISAEA